MECPQGWQVVSFREIADSITERVEDPSTAGVDRYVGLEHLDSDSTYIRRWGSPGEVESTKLRFYAGDVVYGRRRAYQRKLGVADFEGICSAHALVLRARPDVCMRQFLPYFLQSDTFHERALDISVGSLSPTINWRTLATQEFALPPLDVQKRIVELMAALDAASDSVSFLQEKTEVALGAIVNAEVDAMSRDYKAYSLDELVTAGKIQLGRGKVISTKELSAHPGPYPVYSSAEKNNGQIGTWRDFMFDEELITWSVDGGGHLFHRKPHKFSVTNIGGFLRLLTDEMSYSFLFIQLRRLHTLHTFDWQAKAHPSVIRKLYEPIYIPPIPVQEQVIARVEAVDSLMTKTINNMGNLSTMRPLVLRSALASGSDADSISQRTGD